MTKERALRIFKEFFRFGKEMDPEAPELGNGIRRAAGGVVYAPIKGIVYGGKSVINGVVMSSAAIIFGATAIVANVAFGVKEMGEAGINTARRRRDLTLGKDRGQHQIDGRGILIAVLYECVLTLVQMRLRSTSLRFLEGSRKRHLVQSQLPLRYDFVRF